MNEQQKDMRPFAGAIGRLLLRNYHVAVKRHWWIGSWSKLVRSLSTDDDWQNWEDRPQTRSEVHAMLERSEELRRLGIKHDPSWTIYLEFTDEMKEALS
jgi:hypothetical protein